MVTAGEGSAVCSPPACFWPLRRYVVLSPSIYGSEAAFAMRLWYLCGFSTQCPVHLTSEGQTSCKSSIQNKQEQPLLSQKELFEPNKNPFSSEVPSCSLRYSLPLLGMLRGGLLYVSCENTAKACRVKDWSLKPLVSLTRFWMLSNFSTSTKAWRDEMKFRGVHFATFKELIKPLLKGE